jgi:hypothetical protein
MSIVTGAVAALSVVAIAHHLRLSMFNSNLKAIRTWVRDMDIVAHGQRYQGSRVETLLTFYVNRPSFGTVTTKYLCRTKSGRYFDLAVTAERSLVTRWTVEQFSADEAAIALAASGTLSNVADTPSSTTP